MKKKIKSQQQISHWPSIHLKAFLLPENRNQSSARNTAKVFTSSLCGCHSWSGFCATGFSAAKRLSGPISFSQLSGSKIREAEDTILHSSVLSLLTQHHTKINKLALLYYCNFYCFSLFIKNTSLILIHEEISSHFSHLPPLATIIYNFLTSHFFHSMMFLSVVIPSSKLFQLK